MFYELLQIAKAYFLLTKPNVWWLLAFTGAAGIIAASGGLPPLDVLAPSIVSITAGVAETKAVSNYIERGLDAAMKNTSKFQSDKAQSTINLFYVPKPINKLGLYQGLNKDTWHFLFKF